MATNSSVHAARITKVRTGFAAAAIPKESVQRVIEMFDALPPQQAAMVAKRTEFTVYTFHKIAYTNGENRRQMARALLFTEDLEYLDKNQRFPTKADEGYFRSLWQKNNEATLKALLHQHITALLNQHHKHLPLQPELKLPGVLLAAPDIVVSKPPEMDTRAYDLWLESCAQEVGELLVLNAFRKYTFVYGTMGKGSVVLKAAKTMFSRASRFKPEQQILERELNLFDTGVRAKTYLHGDNMQMMDMYYGQAGNDLYKLRDPHIGAFLHKAMRFKGEFSPNVSGRDAYMNTYNTTIEGWDAWTKNGPRINNTTITVEMSRIIRWGVQRYKGKLTFEGKEIYYSQVFDRNTHKGDTEKEALGLFPYFFLGSTHVVPFGTGTLTFMWNGVPTVPSHCHFLSNWGFTNSDEGKRRQAQLIQERRANAANATRLASFHKFSVKKDDAIGAQHHSKLNRGVFEEYLKEANVSIDYELWNKFVDKPPGTLQTVSNATIIRLLQGA